jgi:RND family efflux transporter MFP subunit
MKPILPCLLAIPLLAGLAPPGHAAQPLGCLIEPHRVVELGSPVIGILEQVHVERGSAIHKGQVLASLRAEVERAAADVAQSRAQADADLRAAQANRDFNRDRLKRAEDLVKQGFISTQALDQTRTEAQVAEQRLAQAREQKTIWDREHQLARSQVAQRNLISPLDGVVVDRYLSPGERVEEKPVLKLAALNPLRVEVFMPAASYHDIKPGMTATVQPELPNAGERTARVTLVDRIVDPASNTFRVRLELPNPGNTLPAGLRCKVALGGQVVGAENKATSGPGTLKPLPSAAGAPATAANAAPAAPATSGKITPAPVVNAAPAAKPAPAEAKPATPPKPAAPAEAKAEAKPVAKAEAKLDTKPETKAEAKPMAKPDAKAAPKPEAKPDAKAAPKAEAKPEAKAETKPAAPSVDGVRQAVEAWRAAWAAQNVDAYVAAYVADYTGGAADREAWLKQRRERLTAAGALSLRLDDIQVDPVGAGEARVRFLQRYASDNLKATARKTLTLVARDGRWLIREERAEGR